MLTFFKLMVKMSDGKIGEITACSNMIYEIPKLNG